jgi:hypothetical protein
VNRPRSPYCRKPDAASLANAWELPKWIRATHLSRVVLRDSTVSGQKKIFAIVSRPIAGEIEGGTMRRILIFDNHPDSLRLVFESGVDPDSDDAASRRERWTSITCGLILIAMLVAAMLWRLCW